MQMHFLTEVRHAKKIFINDKSLCVHGIHTLDDHLHRMSKKERNILMEQYIYTLNHTHNDMNIVLIHSPDGLEFLLSRLKATKQIIVPPTLFFAGHTHGAMFDIPYLRHFGLKACNTSFGRYKGWYWPQGKYENTGNWKMYVSTGMGNSPGCDFRMNADPEVVLFTL
jgi:predicted MPP superfamily phosphohydrolase